MADLIGGWSGAPGIVDFATAHGTRCQGVEAFNATLGRPSGWNFLSAKTAAAMKIASSSSCAARNGASDWVGARALRNDSFWNDCTTATKQLRYSASSAVTTWIQRQAPPSRRPYSANSARASATRETMPIACPGVKPVAGKRKPVTLVSTVAARKSAVQ